jgi:threonine/homoserine/homoserine lactone efflux protein
MDTPLALYVVASLALILTPGQDMIYVATRALAQGRFAGVCSALGVIVGILVHTALAALGVGAILQASEGWFLALKLLGAAYLVYLGIRMLLSQAPALQAAAGLEALRPWALFWQGVLSNVTNPKIVLFFFAFLPQFVDPASAHPTRDRSPWACCTRRWACR